jgi:undecaprenyl-diphosphatase
MLTEIFLAIIQAATEFLPISSSGHLALFSNLLSTPNLSFFTTLHLASLIAVIIFTRKEIIFLLKFDKKSLRLWKYLMIATIPAGLFGFLFNDFIASTFSSYLFLALAFLFTSFILFLTKFTNGKGVLNSKNAMIIGLFQVLALFPGVSRSGMTISSGLFSGLERKTAARFSFLLLIPLVIGAFVLEFEGFYFSISLLVSFIICLFFSLLFLSLLTKVIEKGKFWWFSIYCLAISIISFLIYFSS